MMVGMLVAAIGLVLAGLLAIGFGIPVKEFSFGNTLILTGAIGVCTGLIMLGLAATVRELKNIARRLGAGISAASGADIALQPAVPPAGRAAAPGDSGFLFSRDQPAAESAAGAEPVIPPSRGAPPWLDEAPSRDRGRGEIPSLSAPEPAEAGPAPKRRNLLFSSTTTRKERERAQARASEPSTPDLWAPTPESGEPAARPEDS